MVTGEENARFERLLAEGAKTERLVEANYRSGYLQGYFAAAHSAEALKKNGYGRAQEVSNILLAHAKTAVAEWRFAPPESYGQKPPRLQIMPWNRRKAQVYRRDGRQCQICGVLDGPFEVDHVKGVWEGGLSHLW